MGIIMVIKGESGGWLPETWSGISPLNILPQSVCPVIIPTNLLLFWPSMIGIPTLEITMGSVSGVPICCELRPQFSLAKE
jgi:hypothetical protein